jgi:hypothetical protein
MHSILPVQRQSSLDLPQGRALDVQDMGPCLETDWALLFLHRSAILPAPLP